jgi:hypothetical protein
MAIQYYMRGYNTVAHTGAPIGYVDWVVNDAPDSTATYVTTVNANYVPAEIANIIVNRVVQSKVDNFLKPNESVTGTGADGYWLHVNAYDWLNNSPLTLPPNPPIPVPPQVTGLAIVRGTVSGTTPRDFSTLLWDEVNQIWKFALNTDGDGLTVGALQDVALGALSMNGPLTLGSPASLTGMIRLPSNQADSTGDTGAIKSRNAGNSADIFLVQADSGDRVRLGSTVDPVYVPSSLRADGYILASFDASSTLVSQTGFIRNPNATTIVTARTFNSLNDINLLATDVSNNIIIGNTNAVTTVLNNAAGTYVFQNNGALNFKVLPANIAFESTVLTPVFNQSTTGVGNGQSLTVQAQNATAASTTGGALNLTSGTGTTASGNVNVQTGGVTRVIISPTAVTQETATYAFGGTADLASVANPTIKQNNLNVASGVGNTLTVQAQNSVGTSGTGGSLVLTSGTGTSVAGNLKIQTGGVDQVIVTPGKVTITGNLEVQGTTTTVDSTVVDIVGRVIHSNWTDPTTSPNVGVPTQITGYTIHRGNALGVPRDSAALMWTEGALNSGADGYWRATTYTGDGYGLDGYTIATGGINSLGIMGNNFTAASTPNPAVGSLPGIGGLRTQNNTTAVSARNAASNADLLLLGSDASNHVVLGATTSPTNAGFIFNTTVGSVYDFQVNSISNKIQIGDGYVRAGSTPSLTGIFRNTQTANVANPIVTSRNFGNTLDMLLLGTDGYNKSVYGDGTVNAGHVFNTSTGSVYDFQVNSVSNKIQIGDGYIRSGAVPATVGIFRNSQTTQVATDIVTARNAAATNDLRLLGVDGYDRITYGSAALNKGHIFDTAVDGYYDFRVAGISSAYVDGYKFAFNQGRRRHITPVSTTYQVLVKDDFLAIDSSTVYTVTMPASPTLGDAYEFKDVNGTATINNVTIAGNGKNIDGASTLVVNTNYASFVLTYTGTQWSVS